MEPLECNTPLLHDSNPRFPTDSVSKKVPLLPERGRYFLSLALNNRFQKDFFCGSSPVPLGCAAPP